MIFSESSTGGISGAASFAQGSSATSVLAGSNSYSGATTVSNGTLSLTGSLTGGTAISTSGSSSFSESSTGVISGASSITQGSSGTSVLTGTNTYTGATTLTAGTLSVGTSANLGGGASNLVFDGGALQITGTSLTSVSGIGHTVSFNSGMDVSLDIANAANTFTVDQALNQGTGGFYKYGAGTVILNQVNTFDGTTSALGWSKVYEGTLLSTKFASLPGVAADSWATAAGATLAVRAGGAGEWTSSNLDTLLGGAGTTDAFEAGSKLGVEVTGTNTFTYANDIGGTSYNSVPNLTKGLVKLGTGTLSLTGTNTYTGATTVSAGKLVVNGSISTSVLTTVASGATLGGSGTVGALTIESGAFVTPGNSPGILSVNGNYTQAGQYTAEIAGATAGSGYDQISVTGTVNITGGSLVALFSSGSYAYGDKLFILLNDDSDAITGTYTGFAQGATVVSYGGFDWQISYTADSTGNTFTGGNDIALMAIPEPNIAALIGGFSVLALLRRRR